MPERFTSIALALLVAGPVALLLRAEAVSPSPQTSVSFANDIEPILERSCRSCHGDTAPMGRSISAAARVCCAAAFAGRISFPATPKKAACTDVWPAREAGDASERFPLAADEIAVVKRWIHEGAKWDAAGFAERNTVGGRARRPGDQGDHRRGAELLGI